MKLAQHRITWLSMLTRGVVFAIIWWMLTDGDHHSWWVGAPAVILATTINVIALGPIHMRWMRLLWFVPFFIKRSLVGAVDVSRRVLHPSMPLAPVLVRHPLMIPEGSARTLLLNIISLLPGTLSVDIHESCLTVHVLDGATDFGGELVEVEQAVARLYGLESNGECYETAY